MPKFIEPFTQIEDYELFPIDKSHKLVKKDTTTDPQELIIILKNVKVRYLPKKFNKITITLDADDVVPLLKIQNHFNQDIGTEEFIKDNCMSLKLDPEMKLLTQALKIGSVLNIAIKFNDVWKMNVKQYVSWKLVDFEEVKVESYKFF